MNESGEIHIRWFTQYQGQVQGPFDTTFLQNSLDRLDTHHLEATLIWRRGFAEWIKASKFQPAEHALATIPQDLAPAETMIGELTQTKTKSKQAPSFTPQTAAAMPPPAVSFTLPPTPNKSSKPSIPHAPPGPNSPVSPLASEMQIFPPPDFSDDRTIVDEFDSKLDKPQTLNQGAFYRVQVSFVDQPMMTKNELLNLIAKQEDISTIAIQDPKSKEWKEVYAYPDIVDKLGISRRKHPRVPILAQFTGRSNRHESFFARIITISEGGLGLTEVHDLKIGDEVEGQMTSPHFFQPINIRADVVYTGLDGYVGLNFSQINDESRAAIVDYMKKFGKSTTGSGNP